MDRRAAVNATEEFAHPSHERIPHPDVDERRQWNPETDEQVGVRNHPVSNGRSSLLDVPRAHPTVGLCDKHASWTCSGAEAATAAQVDARVGDSRVPEPLALRAD